MKKHTCLKWGGIGLALGLAITAWAQDGVVPAALPTTEFDILMSLASSGGLPVVLAYLGWKAGRMGPPTIKVIMAAEKDADD